MRGCDCCRTQAWRIGCGRAPLQIGGSPAMDVTLLWIPATLVAAAAQTARNATQRSLT